MHPDYLEKILKARVYDVAIESPLEKAPILSARLHNTLLLKREDMQPVFSFKLRGAYNKMAQLPAAALRRGVIAASAGNHAQGVALAAQRLGCKAVIVMPVTTPRIKVDAVLARDFPTIQGVILFFSFVYQDTATVNTMEAQIVDLVGKLSPGQRVMGTILPPPGSRILIQHILDRACIGRCFDYGNYEPSADVFRVRARPGNPYVLSNYEDAISTEEGDYTVRPGDLPIYQIYQCNLSGTNICIRSLEAGEKNDRLGIHPGG